MNVIVEFHVEGSRLLLGDTLAAVPGTQAELEQHTANERGRPIFFLWVSDGFAAFDDALTTDETVADATVIDEEDGRRLYRVEFTTTCFYGRYRDAAGKILRMVGSHEGWTCRMRFPDRERLLTFQRHFAERDVPFRIERLYQESERGLDESAMTPIWQRDFGLTPTQHESLLLALERGYYDEPRASGIEGLAEELGVSPQAVAGRLRRAHRNLVENALRNETGGLEEPTDGKKDVE